MATAATVVPPAALLLCGGGSRGAMEVGFYQRLREQDIRKAEYPMVGFRGPMT